MRKQPEITVDDPHSVDEVPLWRLPVFGAETPVGPVDELELTDRDLRALVDSPFGGQLEHEIDGERTEPSVRIPRSLTESRSAVPHLPYSVRAEGLALAAVFGAAMGLTIVALWVGLMLLS